MKSICIFSAQFLPHMGGVERYTYQLARRLTDQGVKVTVVTSNPGSLLPRERMEGFQVYRIPCFNLLEGRYPVLKCNSEFWKMDRILKKQNFDLILINTRFYIHSLYGAKLAKHMRVRSVVIEHGTSHLQIHQKMLDALGAIYEHGLTGLVKHYCKEYYGVSKACNEWLRHFHIQAKGTLYNAVDLKTIREIAEHSTIDYRAMYGITKNDIVIVYTGRLLEEKGVKSLVEAVRKLLLQRDDIYVFIAGDGELEEWVHARKNKHIIPLGKLSYQEVIALLEGGDIFCLPSFSEGFSTSVLEAVACGCYVVTTKRGGTKELIAGKEYGIILPDNKVRTVYRGLLDAASSQEKRTAGTALSYQRLKDHFVWEITAEQVLRLL